MNTNYIPKEKLLLMLQREEEIRMSQWYIDECTKVKDEINGWLRISSEVQQRVANEFGYEDALANILAINLIRMASSIYPDDKRFQTTSVYVRENKAQRGKNKPGDIIHNMTIHNLDGSINNLYDLIKPNYNLVIASSHTWQPFRAHIEILKDVYEEYKEKINIFMIYTTEAHPADVWPIGESAGAINYKHKNINDRKKYAEKFKNKFNFTIPMYLDNMENCFETETSSWPFRYFILKGNKYHFIPEPKNSTYDIVELYDELKKI